MILHSSLVLLLLTPTITSYPLINWFSLDDLFGMKDWSFPSRDLSKEPLVRGLQYRRTYPYSLESPEAKPSTTSTTTTTEPTTTSTTTSTTTELPTTTITTTTSSQAPTTLAPMPELTTTKSTTTSTTATPPAESVVPVATIRDVQGANSDAMVASSKEEEGTKLPAKRDNGEATIVCPDINNNDPKRIFNRGVEFPQSGIAGALTDPSLQSFTCPPNTLFASYSLCPPGICCSNIPVGITGSLILLSIIVIFLSIIVLRPYFTCTRNKTTDDLLPVVYNDWKGAKFSREVCEVEPLPLKGSNDHHALPWSLSGLSSSVHRKVLPLDEEPPAYAAHIHPTKYIQQQQPKILVFHI